MTKLSIPDKTKLENYFENFPYSKPLSKAHIRDVGPKLEKLCQELKIENSIIPYLNWIHAHISNMNANLNSYSEDANKIALDRKNLYQLKGADLGDLKSISLKFYDKKRKPLSINNLTLIDKLIPAIEDLRSKYLEILLKSTVYTKGKITSLLCLHIDNLLLEIEKEPTSWSFKMRKMNGKKVTEKTRCLLIFGILQLSKWRFEKNTKETKKYKIKREIIDTDNSSYSSKHAYDMIRIRINRLRQEIISNKKHSKRL